MKKLFICEYTKDTMFQVLGALLLGGISSALLSLMVLWDGTCSVKIGPQQGT